MGLIVRSIREVIPTDDIRISVISDGEVGDGPILLWVQRAQRANGNLAANLAISIANRLQRPVIACFSLTPSYPDATLRAYHFMSEGLRELPTAFGERGIGWMLRVGEPTEVVPAVVKEIGAACVITDQAPTTPGREWKDEVARRLPIPIVSVDADVVVPTAHFTKLEWAPRTIRPKIGKLLDHYLIPIDDPVATVRSKVLDTFDPVEAIKTFPIDLSVGPAPRLRGGEREARNRLKQFCESHLTTYDVDRNRSDIDGSSGMSPYLHFGQISPIEIAVTALETLREAGKPEVIESFFNELVVQRELAINFALYQPGYDTFEGIPDWGKKTLAEHASDRRPVLYDRAMLEHGATHDPLWNAAQRQMVHEGFMPNRLRMYWAKQMLLWTSSPEEAFAIAVEFNDRYFVDGRDANGYAGISWSIGGRHDRPFPPKRPVFGLVRPMGMNAMKKHFAVDRYIAMIEERYPK